MFLETNKQYIVVLIVILAVMVFLFGPLRSFLKNA